MARKTSGSIYRSGQKGYYYLRYFYQGVDKRIRLLDTDGNPITSASIARIAAERILKHIRETDKVEQLRIIKNDIQDAETAAEIAAVSLQNESATIERGWEIFMSCPHRPKSCKGIKGDNIPPHSTASSYKSYYGRFYSWLEATYPENRLLTSVTDEIANEFMEDINASNAPGTFNKYLQFFKCFFDTLLDDKKITGSNPFKNIERLNAEYNSKKPLTIEQIAKLLERAEGDMRLLIALGYFTGLRFGDCCTLLWREVDLLRQVIERVPRKTVKTVKDKAQAMVKIGIAPFLQTLLSQIPAEQRTGYVLPEFAEKYLSGAYSQLSRRVSKHFQQCGIETLRPGTGSKDKITGKSRNQSVPTTRAVVEIGFHSLRYSYISHNAEAGTPAAIIQRNAGHANPAMTEHYTRISDEAAVRYASVLSLPADKNPIDGEDCPERKRLHDLIDTLDPATVRKLLRDIMNSVEAEK